MTKKEVSQRVLLKGEPLSLKDFTWNEETNTFSSRIDGLIINFKGIHDCTFETESDCVFCTEWSCVFKTGSGCIFDTGSFCRFDTKKYCIFNTGWNCTFKTKGDCVFTTGFHCIFDTGSCCKFNTGGCCIFNTVSGCIFKTGKECVVVRKDVFEVIKLKKDVEIKLNEHMIKGYTNAKPKRTITFDGKEIELSEESYQSFKKQFNN